MSVMNDKSVEEPADDVIGVRQVVIDARQRRDLGTRGSQGQFGVRPPPERWPCRPPRPKFRGNDDEWDEQSWWWPFDSRRSAYRAKQ